MKNDYKLFKVHRLFKEDKKLIKNCYSEYDFLHYNPVNDKFLDRIFIDGSFWGIFDEEKVAALSYMMLPRSKVFSNLTASWEIKDLLNSDLEDYIICGYIWKNKDYEDRSCYAALSKLWEIWRIRKRKKGIIHYMPAHVNVDFNSLFKEGFELIGLRGFDKLVPHYIFVKDISDDKQNINVEKTLECPLSDTKEISKLCEHGYRGYEITAEENILFRR